MGLYTENDLTEQYGYETGTTFWSDFKEYYTVQLWPFKTWISISTGKATIVVESKIKVP